MRFHRWSLQPKPEKIGILAAGFNPPTVAHFDLIYAAGFHVDQVVCVLPREFPHKKYDGASLEQRIEMLAKSVLPPCAIAISESGLFLDIARECRAHFGGATKLYFICGRDAAERVVSWDYGRAGAIEEMFAEFELLVAPRDGDYEPPPALRGHVHSLYIRPSNAGVSSTEVRARIREGKPWDHLVPEPILEAVREIYS